MARYRLLITLAIVSLAFAAYGDQPMFAPRDPGAARTGDLDDLSGVTDASTARSNLDVYSKAETSALIPNNASFTLAGLSEKSYSSLTGKPSFGTMASETATNYVATSTLTAHENDTSTHGKTTLAGMEDVDDLSGVTDAATARTNLGVAASSSTVLTSGANAMTGNLKFLGNHGILQSTSDGADTEYTYLAGGGDESITRGGIIAAFGNDRSSFGGQLRYFAGNVTGGDHVFFTGNGSERMRITNGGNLLLGTTTDDGTNKLQVNGSVAISSFMQLASPTAIPTAAAGRIYFNGTEAKFKKCLNGSTWVDM